MGRASLGRFSGYSVEALRKDLLAGLIVGIVAIPLSMAFAIASGVKPEYGIYSTIIAGIFISIFGGSRYQIGGPTGAFIPILLGIVMVYGYENLLIAGFMAGILLALMGVFRLGSLIKFIPRPVTVGFTSGIAVIIFSGQIGNFLGLSGMERHEDFISSMGEILLHLHSFNLYSVGTALLSLLLIVATPRLFPKMPGPLVGLIVSSVVANLFFPEKIATIGSTFGEIASGLPAFHFPMLTWEKVIQMLQPALVIALLGGIESLLSAVVADRMTDSKHDSNRELVGQGIANIVAPLFGGIPVTGAIARTATNIRNGAASPIAGIVHAFVVLAVLLLFAPYASSIPIASMAPVLMVVAWNMSERKEFIHLLKTRTSDSFILLITFLLTVFANLTIAVEVGLVLAVLQFIRQMGQSVKVTRVLPDHQDKHSKVRAHVVSELHDCPQFRICTVEGPLFFGVAKMFGSSLIDSIDHRPKVLLLRMGKVPYLDTTVDQHLAGIVHHVHSNGGIVLISGMQEQPRAVLQKTGLVEEIGEQHFFEHTGDAIDFALTKLDNKKCIGCKHFAFQECTLLSSPIRESRADQEETHTATASH
ncbi:SulP family inorganic anion transporter [Brevibacillus invocatus]|uniref:SulP family inorganic anion transporter n=1 Tax=Brevibacillus invocatus TaxID=173959 RepID=UPI00203EBE19|nr:SulP family inorganic anion transporter [Brevibacillus invocatus]MCM3429182.1 SulP family inorganic anion transporter [Brevibacillus invocatus]